MFVAACLPDELSFLFVKPLPQALLTQLISHSSWYWYFLCGFVGFVFSLVLYFKHKKSQELPKRILFSLLALRFLSSTGILLLLLQLVFKQLKNETEAPIVILAIDNSSSISSGSEANTKLVEQLDRLKHSIEKKYSVRTILFGSKSRSSDKLNPDFKDKESDIEDLFTDIETNYANLNVGAVIVATDGIYNKGANPIYSVEKMHFPIYTIALGDTNEFRDLLVKKVNHNQIAYFGNQFPVEVQLQAKKLKNTRVKVVITQDGLEKGAEFVEITSDNFSSTCSFTLTADKRGVAKYTAKVEVLALEKNKLNNAQQFLVEVIDNREKILVLANAPHPDVAAIKESILQNSAYELDYQRVGNFNASLKAYGLVIFHGAAANQLPLIAECRNNHIPYLIINPSNPETIQGVRISSSFNRFNDVEPILNADFNLFKMSDAFVAFVNKLPAVKSFFGNYLVNNGSQTLLFQKLGSVETQQPVLLFSEIDGIKSACFIGDGLWKWKMRDFAENKNHRLFDEMLSKTIQYLVVKNDKSLFRIKHPKIVFENELVEMEAEVYNKSYALDNNEELSLTLTNSNKQAFNFAFSKRGKSYHVNLGNLNPGEYNYTASVKVSGEVQKKTGTILVRELVSEKINTVANHLLLQQLSSRSGGKFVFAGQTKELENDLLNSNTLKSITYSSSQISRLIEFTWLFWFLLIVLASEWLIRKRYLTI